MALIWYRRFIRSMVCWPVLSGGLEGCLNRDQIFISDKVGQTRQGPNVWTPRWATVSAPASRSFNDDTGDWPWRPSLLTSNWPSLLDCGSSRWTQKLQDEGKIKHIGLSQVTVDQIEPKSTKIDAIENLYNVANHGDDDVVDYAASQKWLSSHGSH